MTSRPGRRLVLPLLAGLAALAPIPSAAHPMGNFSISHYAALRVDRDAIRLRYVVDMAEIPTFQELQRTGLTPETRQPDFDAYLARTVETLTENLSLEVDGRRLPLRVESSNGLFAPGAGGLPTLKIGAVYRAALDGPAAGGASSLTYRDGNFADRAGWKEIIAGAGPGVTLLDSSVPERDRSRELADYPTDLLDSPPQSLSARLVFTRAAGPTTVAHVDGGAPSRPAGPDSASPQRAPRREAVTSPARPLADRRAPAAPPAPAPRLETTMPPVSLEANRQGTPRNAFTQLIATRHLSPGVMLSAFLIAASLGAFHALEPGHGKTVVAAYLVGSRGTAWHALVLGLAVTLSHTIGVYLLGALTLYASRYVVPERIYPWLGALSGLTITILGFTLFLRRYANGDHAHAHPHPHAHHHAHDQRHPHEPDHSHDHGHHGHGHPHRHVPEGPVSIRALLALGITGGIVPCPAALVVLLSAVALRRVGFGLLLIVAFSIGLAAVLIGIGLLMVYARRFMAGFRGQGPLVTRWLPLTSAAVIALSGVAIAAQALVSAGVVQIRL